jgi:hypothetical protein
MICLPDEIIKLFKHNIVNKITLINHVILHIVHDFTYNLNNVLK